LNVNQRQPQLPTGAVSLSTTTGAEYDLRRLLKAVLDQTKSKYDEMEEPSSILEEWWHNCIHRPPRVQVRLQKRAVTGITRGIDQNGSLILETEDYRTLKLSEGTLRVLDNQAN
jgi:biotin-(acetyl-CoA carboxylase) ligase